MPKKHKPRAGSLQYWPRKRARRIYPSIKNYPEVKEPKPLAFAAYKAGMTRVFFVDNKKGSPTYGETVSHAVTVLDAPPLFVLGIRFYSNGIPSGEIYADNIPKDIKKYVKVSKNKKEPEEYDDLRLIVSTQPRKSGLGKKKPEILEIGMGGTLEEKLNKSKELLGKELRISDVFSEGEFVDVLGVTKGKGFQGVVKRYGVKIRGRKDEEHHRQIGVMGAEGVARVLYSVPQPGQMGFHRRTELNKQIYKIGDKPEEVNPNGGFVNYGIVKGDYILIKGSLPGPKKRLIVLRSSIRARKKGYPIQVEDIDLSSQQGVRI
ncbi:MAG: 50S ribosomal protein L3 [Candidatus Aenigmarchaeota archaeon]|nr:50S ribosomal protein L3 [Candidatus Aenigmarchaeota archaeon]